MIKDHFVEIMDICAFETPIFHDPIIILAYFRECQHIPSSWPHIFVSLARTPPFMVLKMARRTLLKHFQQKNETSSSSSQISDVFFFFRHIPYYGIFSRMPAYPIFITSYIRQISSYTPLYGTQNGSPNTFKAFPTTKKTRHRRVILKFRTFFSGISHIMEYFRECQHTPSSWPHIFVSLARTPRLWYSKWLAGHF